MSVAGIDGGDHESYYTKWIAAPRNSSCRCYGGNHRSPPRIAEVSHELRIAHDNLHNIRLAIAKPEPGPR